MNISEEKKFGLVFFIIFSAFMYLAYYKSNINMLIIFSVINAFLLLSILFKDKLLTGLMRKWIQFAIILSKIMNPIIMLAIYIIAVVPIGIIMKIFMVDILKLKRSKKDSYWVDRESKEPNNMKDQF